MDHHIIQKTIKNGISLVLVPLSNTAAVTAVVLMKVGSRYESDAQQGLAHFTEHMVFKGGRKYTTAAHIAQALDAVGGEFNAFTSQEFTGFYTKTAAKHLELGLDILSDMTLHATFPAVELEKEKGVIVEEINMYEDMPMRKVDQVLSTLAYGDTPLGRPIIGTKETVSNFTREDFIEYRKQFYHGKQCTIAIAGSFDPEEVAAKIEQYFGEMPVGDLSQSEVGKFIDTTDRVLLEHKKSEQTHLMLAVKGYSLDHPKRYAYRIMTTILGGNMSSRLFTSVREEQGLCYYVRASPDTYVDTGMLVVSAGVDNFRLNLAITAIIHEFQKIRDELVSVQELERAKQFLLGKMLLGMEDSEQVAEFYGMQYLQERSIRTATEITDSILAVTAEDILEVAQELFVQEHVRLAVIGPHADAAALQSLLTLHN